MLEHVVTHRSAVSYHDARAHAIGNVRSDTASAKSCVVQQRVGVALLQGGVAHVLAKCVALNDEVEVPSHLDSAIINDQAVGHGGGVLLVTLVGGWTGGRVAVGGGRWCVDDGNSRWWW